MASDLTKPDLEEIEQAYTWLTGKKPYLGSVNNKPHLEERAALVLGILNYSAWFCIFTNGNIISDWVVRGVVIQKHSDEGEQK